MTDRITRFWSGGSSPGYHKLAAHSRTTSLESSDDGVQLRNTIRKLRRWLLLLSVLLVISVLALSANLALQATEDLARRSPVPKLPTKSITFRKHDRFANVSTPESDRAWDRLVPPDQGSILVEHPEDWSLPDGLRSKHGTGGVYDMTAFHGIRCLTSIRQYLWHLRFARETNTTEQVKSILLEPQQEHIILCFDYLRQSLMCSADTTLEWPAQGHEGVDSTIDGWGVRHQCIDWKALLKYAKENAPR